MEIQKICKLQGAFLLLAFLGVAFSSASAQQDRDPRQPQYTLASLCGDYGAIATYGANVARALGVEVADGHGNLTGSAIVNQPGPNNTRVITKIGITGTYHVNPDGTGTMVLAIALPGGSTASVTEDFLITKVKVANGIAIATQMEDAQEVPSAVIDDTSLVIHSYTLRTAPASCAQLH